MFGNSKTLVPSLFLTIFIGMIAAVVVYFNMKYEAPQIDITQFQQPRALPDFSLGKPPFNNQSLVGHWSLLFFGYTHCSDICPMTLGHLSQHYVKLKKDFPSLQVVFVSLDPAHDNSAATQSYVQNFNADFKGVTGSAEELTPLTKALGLFAEKDPEGIITHSSSIFLINPLGFWQALFPFDYPDPDFEREFNLIAKPS